MIGISVDFTKINKSVFIELISISYRMNSLSEFKIFLHKYHPEKILSERQAHALYDYLREENRARETHENETRENETHENETRETHEKSVPTETVKAPENK